MNVPTDVLMVMVQIILALAVFAVRSEMKGLRDVLTVRLDAHEKRLDKMDS